MDMWHVFIFEVYSGAGRVRQKIWTHIYVKFSKKKEADIYVREF